MRAREINPTVRIVVRMWDTQLSNHLKNSLNAETLSSSDLAAPAFAGHGGRRGHRADDAHPR